MNAEEIDTIIARLLPHVLADRELGNGRSFTTLHLRRLWALTCLYTGEYIEETEVVEHVGSHLPARMQHSREVGAS